MGHKRVATGPPNITEDVFEDFLVTDDLLVDYFNEFLSLPTFSEEIKFNKTYGVFEVISNIPDQMEQQIKKMLRDHELPNPIYNATRSVTGLSWKKSSLSDVKIDNNYTVMCLNREQGVEWIKKERLPAFLMSDCYFEYRFAKLLSQVKVNNTGVSLEIDPHYQPWTLKRAVAASPSPDTENEEIMKEFFVTLGQASFTQTKEWFTMAKQSTVVNITNSVSGTVAWGDNHNQEVLQTVSRHQRPSPSHTNKTMLPAKFQRDSKLKQDTWEEDEYSASIAPSPTPSPIRIYVEQKQEQKPEDSLPRDTQNTQVPVFPTMDDFTVFYVDQVMKSAVSKLNGKLMKKSVDEVDIFTLSQVTIQRSSSTGAHSTSSEESVKEELDIYASDSDEGDILDVPHNKQKYSHIRCRKEFEKFKSFIRATSGEKLFLLWMDIERLKTMNDPKRKHRHLNKMKNLYMVVTGDQYLQAEVLARLNLLDTNQWHESHLQTVQTEVAKPLLLYWAQIRSLSSRPATVHASVVKERVGSKSQRSDMEQDALSNADTNYSVLKSSKMEVMLQALHLDSRAGYFFTTFCEQSGNKLWENGVHFWFDLQSYHHLFYQETLQPFKLRRHSQLIFGTYLAPSASMDIGVEQTIRKEIYQKLDPPFEDLFDSAEEYVLTILLSSWIQMTELDRQAYGKVELVEESRQLESANYQKLQALQQEEASKKDEVQVSQNIFVPPPDVPKEPNLWELVPEEYRNYNLGTLLRHRMELEYFRSFLEDHFASMDLKCWLDLEHLRRGSHRKKEERLETSKDIKSKYLNKKYFFGPNSPATRDQQEQVMMLAGGWGKLLHDRLPSTVVTEIQKYVRMRIEKKWLPMFLSTEEFGERQKRKSQMKDVAEDVISQTNKKKLGVWKQLDSKWISSSKEIIAFRKALLNPITANQFQRFISLKGDFFENGLLFWQEVQKYKELCHSHCDESTIQNKITAIINCFINSSIPPALQIDIPPEQAEKIMERRRDLGPYVFREAQMTIFSIMFKFWSEFCEFRRRLTDEKIVPLLERKKAKKAEKIKQKMREQEKLAKHTWNTRRLRRQTAFPLQMSLLPGRISRNPLQAILDDKHSGGSTPSQAETTKCQQQQQEASKRKNTFSDIYNDNDSTYSEQSSAGRDIFGRNRNVSWSYSKYLEALEQERMLLKIQQDLENKAESSVMSDDSSVYSVKTEESKRTGKTINSSSHQSGPTQRMLSAARR